ncbi:MAG TPA: sugar ABC transporter ATP-binding protein [Jatrophihabitantaceae bacterium]|jgi:ribose transport system ATP-binding protein|nr:sugar ABC transporter ATP-binding protein [Jatrophihabitantaceae bacterium]
MSLVITQVSKTFPGQRALHELDLSVAGGEVHALLGQNGSGKSTLIKILSGYHQPDDGGRAERNGIAFELGSARAARSAGLRFVHQDLGLVLSLSVFENVMLDRSYPVAALGRIRSREARRQVRSCFAQLGLDVDPDAPLSSLSLAERTAVAIARVLPDERDEPIILILDEPTAALPADEVAQLLETISRLRDAGHGVLFVSHHLNEVLKIADRVTVLRDGVAVARLSGEEVDPDALTALIVGTSTAKVVGTAQQRSAERRDGRPMLEVEGLRGGRLHGIDLEVHPGEIVGIAGITGSGREVLVSLVAGLLARSGSVSIDGRVVAPGSPRKALASGLAAIPGERARYGLFSNLDVRENMMMLDMRSHRRWGRIAGGAEVEEVRGWISTLGIATRGAASPIGSLSGGNQQKVLIARALRTAPKVLLLDDPTQGIDVGARAQIHRIIEESVRDGMAVLLVSTDSDELARLADRVLVLAQGRLTQALHRDAELTAEAIDVAQLSRQRLETMA